MNRVAGKDRLSQIRPQSSPQHRESTQSSRPVGTSNNAAAVRRRHPRRTDPCLARITGSRIDAGAVERGPRRVATIHTLPVPADETLRRQRKSARLVHRARARYFARQLPDLRPRRQRRLAVTSGGRAGADGIPGAAGQPAASDPVARIQPAVRRSVSPRPPGSTRPRCRASSTPRSSCWPGSIRPRTRRCSRRR